MGILWLPLETKHFWNQCKQPDGSKKNCRGSRSYGIVNVKKVRKTHKQERFAMFYKIMHRLAMFFERRTLTVENVTFLGKNSVIFLTLPLHPGSFLSLDLWVKNTQTNKQVLRFRFRYCACVYWLPSWGFFFKERKIIFFKRVVFLTLRLYPRYTVELFIFISSNRRRGKKNPNESLFDYHVTLGFLFFFPLSGDPWRHAQTPPHVWKPDGPNKISTVQWRASCDISH